MKLFNSLSKQKETFEPITQGKVGMYVCGITPYDTTHLGHAFTYTAFDVLYRLLEQQGSVVNYVQNVTDIDDDILKRAKRDNKDWRELGNFWTDKYRTDMQTLNNKPPTQYVKATDNINTIVEIVSDLVEKKLAYEVDGNVYFDVTLNPEYGKLSGYSVAEMIELSAERGADPQDKRKRNPLDFILWQKSTPDEPYWETLWSNGRPGWHIECSAMAYQYIDKKIDIHGGGSDLIYPHHESEIAQTECFTEDPPFAKFWLHTGAVGYQGEKMSKSLGNLIMVSELLKTFSPNAIRYQMLSHHYRKAWEYTEDELQTLAKTVDTIEEQLIDAVHQQQETKTKTYKNEIMSALKDDLNTPLALELLNKTIANGNLAEAKETWTLLGFTLEQ